MSKDCKTCQRFNKKTGECMVMIELIKDCWAWTNDKNWEKKVRKDVIKYAKAKGLINGGITDANS